MIPGTAALPESRPITEDDRKAAAFRSLFFDALRARIVARGAGLW